VHARRQGRLRSAPSGVLALAAQGGPAAMEA
jgi:hypothetical protein